MGCLRHLHEATTDRQTESHPSLTLEDPVKLRRAEDKTKVNTRYSRLGPGSNLAKSPGGD